MSKAESHQGIPTIYNGIRFRSRTEARWAALFDLIGCEYEYEPLDFNGYIPDFLLDGTFWVEVKAATTQAELRAEAPKVRRALAQDGRRAIVVGGTLLTTCDRANDREFGVLAIDHHDVCDFEEHGATFAPDSYGAVEWMRCTDCKQYRWQEADGAFGGTCGHSWRHNAFNPHDLREQWAEAGNMTQWEGAQTLIERTARLVAEGRMSERDGDLAVLAEASRLYAERLAAIRRRRGQAQAA